MHETQTSGDIDSRPYTTGMCIACPWYIPPRYREVTSDLVIMGKVVIFLHRHLRSLSRMMAVNPAASAMDVGTLSVNVLPLLPCAKVMKALGTATHCKMKRRQGSRKLRRGRPMPLAIPRTVRMLMTSSVSPVLQNLNDVVSHRGVNSGWGTMA